MLARVRSLTRISLTSVLLAASVHAQVLDRVIAPTTALTGWEVLGNATYKTRTIVVGDFDGDNLDDLFWDEQGSSSYRIGVLRANGDGTFAPIYSTKGSPFMKPNSPFDLLAGGSYVTGRFYGGTTDLLLQYSNFRYYLYAFGQGTIYPQSGRLYVIGKTKLESAGAPTKLVAGRFVPGLARDVLLSFELLSSGGQTARLQRHGPFTDDFTELWNNAATPQYFGGWYFNYGNDEFFVADFLPGNDTEELLCINRTNGWLKIMRFDGQNWVDVYANYGTYEVYPTPTTGAFTFNQSTHVLAGNFDTTDPNAEVVFFDPSRQIELHVFEFDPATRTFRAGTRPARNINGLERRARSSGPPVRVYERWRTERVCKKRFLGICLKWEGGNQIQQERDFYTEIDQDGDLQVIGGRFYNNGWAIPWSHDLLVFRDAYIHIPDLPPHIVFYTDCRNNHMYSGQCPAPVSLFNVLGQVINRYDPATGWFEKRTAYGQESAVFSTALNNNL